LNVEALQKYGISGNRIKKAIRGKNDEVMQSLLMDEKEEDGFARYCINELYGISRFIIDVSEQIGLSFDIVKKQYDLFSQQHPSKNVLLKGAEVVGIMLHKLGVKNAVCYPGTSELSLCSALKKNPHFRMINGRGDTESAFSAAGANIYNEGSSICVLHGARGLTNAIGAIADIRRNEVGLLCLVGMPSMQSDRFLPPHGEIGLINNSGSFAKSFYEARFEMIDENILSFVKMIVQSFKDTIMCPRGSVILGIPQNILDTRWIPLDALSQIDISDKKDECDDKTIKAILDTINNSCRPVIIVDDFAFRRESAKKIIIDFASKINATLFQLGYRRGPMLFEQIISNQCNTAVGHYLPTNQVHREYLENADLIITIDDRNMYKRVIGEIPKCKKIAITENRAFTLKNEYINLDEGDIILCGNICESLLTLLLFITSDNLELKEQNIYDLDKIREVNTFCGGSYDYVWDMIVNTLGEILKKQKEPIIIDDSQMFGGVISKHYNKLSNNVRVFGDHGAFVGAGISYSFGAGLMRSSDHILCTLGDQGFTNGFQGLICANDEKSNVIYIVCNNGKSVSLLKQYAHDNKTGLEDGTDLDQFLGNSKALSYCKASEAFGIKAIEVDLRDISETTVDMKQKELKNALLIANSHNGPSVIELIFPDIQEIWDGVWELEGLD